LTKRQAEQLAEFLSTQGLRVRYLHSDIDTVERIETLRDLRRGIVQVVVGVNLLREGLDLPEVGLVAVLDADTQGFLRSATSLIQTIGRAARNPEGEVILYADKITPAMRNAIDETDRRRQLQNDHNETHGLSPTRLTKTLRDVISDARIDSTVATQTHASPQELRAVLDERLVQARQEMVEASARLAFEEAAMWRDEISDLRRSLTELDAVSLPG
jgi:excinuclease ABC subunit B